jgi:hypothetical protein
MPHFILQAPVNPSRPITGEQVIEQLRVCWPNIRNQEIGILRSDDWGRAANVTHMAQSDAVVDTPLEAGDVLYIDGGELDHSQVLEAAKSIAQLMGAKIRKQ